MTAITTKMDLINEISREILAYLEREDSDLGAVVTLLHKRMEVIKMVDDLLSDHDMPGMTADEERLLLGRFERFRSLHEKTEPLLAQRMESQKEHIGGATQIRKAEEKYQFSGEPDISYFSNAKSAIR